MAVLEWALPEPDPLPQVDYPVCASCKCYIPASSFGGKIGCCRRHPPASTQVGIVYPGADKPRADDMQSHIKSYAPDVAWNWWCGDWVSK